MFVSLVLLNLCAVTTTVIIFFFFLQKVDVEEPDGAFTFKRKVHVHYYTVGPVWTVVAVENWSVIHSFVCVCVVCPA